MSGVNDLVQTFVSEYKKTPTKLKVCWAVWHAKKAKLGCSRCCSGLNPPASGAQVLDAFMVYALLTAAVQVGAHALSKAQSVP